MNDTRIGGNMFSFFRKRNTQQPPSADPANLPEDVLILCLFENAILHAQNLVRRLGVDKENLSAKIQAQLASQISEYALAIMVFYFQAADKVDLQQKVVEKHEKFLVDNCGTNDEKTQKHLLDVWRQEIQRKIQYLNMGNRIINLEKNTFALNIISDGGFRVELDKHELTTSIEQFVRDVDDSMKHFGILPKPKLSNKPAGRMNQTPTQKL